MNENYCVLCHTIGPVNKLSCSHFFCDTCLHKPLLNQIAEVKKISIEKVTIKCPVCNEGKIEMQKSTIIEKIKKSSIMPAKLCSKHLLTYSKICLTCSDKLCSECELLHNEEFPDNDHLMKESNKETETGCHEHRKTAFQYVCIECNLLLCTVCYNNHKKFKHNLEIREESETVIKKKINVKDEILNSDKTKKMSEKITEEGFKINQLIDNMINNLTDIKNDYNEKQMKTLNSIKNTEEIAKVSVLKYNEEVKANIPNDGIWNLLVMKKISERDFDCNLEFDYECKIESQLGKFLDEMRTTIQSDWECIQTLSGHTNPIHSLITLHDGKLVSGSKDNTIRIWDPDQKFACVSTIGGQNNWVYCLLTLPDGLVATGSDDSKIKILDPSNNYLCMNILDGHQKEVNYLLLLPDGKLASGSDDMTIKIWDPKKNYQCINTLKDHTLSVWCLLVLPNENLVSASEDYTIKIWDKKNNYKLLKTLYGHTSSVYCLTLLPNGNFASGSDDKSIKIWDCNNDYKCIFNIVGHLRAVYCLIVLPDGKLVSGSFDKTIKIWDPNQKYHCINTLEDHTGSIWSLLLLEDGKMVSGSYDNSIKIWSQKYKIK
jgi:WD40 repeat protein